MWDANFIKLEIIMAIGTDNLGKQTFPKREELLRKTFEVLEAQSVK